LEELIYWGIIFLFYLFSAYRSRQKKVDKEEIQAPNPLPTTENKNQNTDFNIFEFLDEAMEKSAVEFDDSVTANFVESPNKEAITLQKTQKSVQSHNTEIDGLNTIVNRKVSNQSYDIKDKHLDHLKSRINTNEISKSRSEQKILTLQQKLKNKPTKLAIVMKAIFDPPKSQGI
tara:strand:+ start:2198 stop:2719 length:522 start_codon:yes stop_codon:yes gene_type:complete